MSGRIRGILFDKDGTLFDFSRTWEAWAQNFLRRVAPAAPDARRLGVAIGFDVEAGRFSADSIVIAGTPLEIVERLQPLLPEWNANRLFALINEEAARAPQAEAVPLAALLNQLGRQGYRLGVATNDAEAPALAHLEAAGVRAHFEFVAGSDSGHGGKPAPGQLLAFAAATGLPPAACVMVGDSRHDLVAGRAAGFATVGVLTGLAPHAALADLADIVLPDIGHLPEWLSGQN